MMLPDLKESDQHSHDHDGINGRIRDVADQHGDHFESGLVDECKVHDHADDGRDEREETEEEADGGGRPVEGFAARAFGGTGTAVLVVGLIDHQVIC